MRIDRLLALNFFHPLRIAIERSNGIRIPILMYHSISDEPESGHPYFWTNTSPKRFTEQMRFLKENDYKVISLTEAAEILYNAKASGFPMVQDRRTSFPRYVVLTFDDGFGDFHAEAFPILREYGFFATVFLPTGLISGVGSVFKGKRCLCWEEIRELAAAGIHFGSHTVTHPNLKTLPWDRVEQELSESKKTLEGRLGMAVESISYPYAFPEEDRRFRTRMRCSLKEYGYRNGVTTNIGAASMGDDRLFLNRVPINSDDDPSLFRLKLEGGYDWMHWFQYGKKVLWRIGTRGPLTE